MLIRHAEAARDAAACASIYARYVRETVISLEEVPPSANEMAARMGRVLATHPWLVAEDEGAVVGYAYATSHRERAAYRWATDVSVYVAADHHRRGIGTALYRALFGLLVRQGLLLACAGVTLPNDASVALHEGFGFKPVGIYRGIGWKAGAWRDVGWWQLDLVRPRPGPPPEPGPLIHPPTAEQGSGTHPPPCGRGQAAPAGQRPRR
jgi:L-amino acid N-acyltransferase YncA